VAFPTDISDARFARHPSIRAPSNLDAEVSRLRMAGGAQSGHSHVRRDREPARCV